MIRIHVDDATLLGLRMTISPLWEALSSLALLVRYRAEMPYPYDKWAHETQTVIRQPRYRELLTWTTHLRMLRWPSFLAPLTLSGSATLDDELSVLRATSAEAIIDEFHRLYHPAHVPAPMLRFAQGDGQGVDRFADLVADYWQAAVAPYWPAMHGVLDEEILLRGRTLATGGSGAMLADLGGHVRWEGRRLTMPHQLDLDWAISNAKLIIVPVIFARGMRIFSAIPGGTMAVSYQARGAAVLAGRPATGTLNNRGPEEPDRLAILLGRGRASVLRALAAPATTTTVAGVLGLAPSTVSQHLATLSAAGMVRRRRVGGRVLYELDQAGLTLVSDLGR
jgi:DNA-binding transcriptional ArsR family regulator